MPALAAENRFGRAIALEGDLLVVGSRADDTGGTSGSELGSRSCVFVLRVRVRGFQDLSYVKKLTSGEGAGNMPVLADGDHFGSALALDREIDRGPIPDSTCW